jgi:hypothetical protein
MPPEQGQGLSDIVDHRLGFGAHRFLKLLWMDDNGPPGEPRPAANSGQYRV